VNEIALKNISFRTIVQVGQPHVAVRTFMS